MSRSSPPSIHVIGRLAQYRRLLASFRAEGLTHVFSHGLAARAGLTSAQVRRDIMQVGYLGSPARGYEIEGLARCLAQYLEQPDDDRAVLAGVGNLGRALVSYFDGSRNKFRLVGIFDNDPAKVHQEIHGFSCRPIVELPRVVAKTRAAVGIIAVPAPQAQDVAALMVQSGILGLVNFAPVPLVVPPEVYVEAVDLTLTMERVSFMARLRSGPKPS